MRGRTSIRAGIVNLLALASLLLVAGGAQSWFPAGAGPRYTERRIEIAPGLTLLRMTDWEGPNKIRVLEIDPYTELTLDVELANETIPGHEQTSSMAARNGAIAAVNGDYTMLPSDPQAGRPVNLFAEDGRLITSPLIYGRNFAISNDEQNTFFTHPSWGASLVQHDTGETWSIEAWNEHPFPDELALTTAEGGSMFRPLPNACAARLQTPGAPTWRADRIGVDQSYIVETVQCSEKRLRRRGGVVISAPIGSWAAAGIQATLVAGETVTLGWTSGWPGVLETIGGNPTVVRNGRLAGMRCEGSYFCDPNPRTGVGVRSDGTLLLVTVDGRQPQRSIGMTLPQFGELFQYLGATWALNMDGGGSTTMWVQGRIVNRPSQPDERPVGSALLVLPGPDYAEPLPTTPSQTSTATLEPPQSACKVLKDPGSTGGLLDAIAAGDLRAGRRPLPHALARIVEVFRGERSCADVLGPPNLER